MELKQQLGMRVDAALLRVTVLHVLHLGIEAPPRLFESIAQQSGCAPGAAPVNYRQASLTDGLVIPDREERLLLEQGQHRGHSDSIVAGVVGIVGLLWAPNTRAAALSEVGLVVPRLAALVDDAGDVGTEESEMGDGITIVMVEETEMGVRRD
ncbi:hypothetical protein N7532_001492 [Penicillium argentinense]|uniref:Uncharacterized protein n=1 Tax=Penicillium argentinense TaxID=1131581 RepID=A0A9W9KMJ3_9EURO|nr:uncharacterized protein N7532_001492 [Penicillium argentinense]KAJ5110957.1 hypothetical protein N7532_001492 [Penicillium argentinense]